MYIPKNGITSALTNGRALGLTQIYSEHTAAICLKVCEKDQFLFSLLFSADAGSIFFVFFQLELSLPMAKNVV